MCFNKVHWLKRSSAISDRMKRWCRSCRQSRWAFRAPAGVGSATTRSIDDLHSPAAATRIRCKRSQVNALKQAFVANNNKADFLFCFNIRLRVCEGLEPLFGIDVWEHAYYLQYKNVRADYIKNIFKIANWRYVEELYRKENM